MKRLIYIIGGILLLMVSCTSRKSPDNVNISDADSIAVMDSLRPDTLHHPSPDELDGHMPPPPPDSAHDKHLPPPPPDSDRVDGHRPPPPPDGMHPDGPPPPPPHGKGHHKPDNMRGFDPASENDMDDNGMSW